MEHGFVDFMYKRTLSSRLPVHNWYLGVPPDPHKGSHPLIPQTEILSTEPRSDYAPRISHLDSASGSER